MAEIGRVAQDLAEPCERQPLRRDGEVGGGRERRQHDDDHRQLQEGDDREGRGGQPPAGAVLAHVAHAMPAHRLVNRLDSQMIATAMKVSAKESAEPLGQSRSCMYSS